MAERKTITLLQSGNTLVVNSLDPQVRELVASRLCYVAKKILYGAERYAAGTHLELQDYQCFSDDFRGRISTSIGFYDRLTKALKRHDYNVVLKNLAPLSDPTIFEPRWDRIFEPNSAIELRPGQDEFLMKVFSYLKLQLPSSYDCPPGYGKSMLIGLIALLLPKAKIHVTSKRVPVLRDRIYPALCMMLPDVGMCGGGLRSGGHRVQLFTFDSLHHSDGKADIVIIDEVHEAAADDAAEQLGKYHSGVFVGLSATHNMRLDNKNLRAEGMCGPVVYKMTYGEAVGHGMVVPIEVHWQNVVMDMDPCEGATNDVDKKRWGIWRNSFRNRLIAKNVRAHPDQQVLIPCETIEHALALKKLLPDFTMVYAVNGIKPEDIVYFKLTGLWPTQGLKLMTTDRLKALTIMFERNKLKKVICTTVWNVGVNFQYLEVVARADAGGSPIMDTQIPGRGSRINKEINKTKAIVYDYKDQFNTGFKRKAASRKNSYAANGWLQVIPGRNPNTPVQHLLWEDS